MKKSNLDPMPDKKFVGGANLDVISLTKDDFIKLGKIAEMLKSESEVA